MLKFLGEVVLHLQLGVVVFVLMQAVVVVLAPLAVAQLDVEVAVLAVEHVLAAEVQGLLNAEDQFGLLPFRLLSLNVSLLLELTPVLDEEQALSGFLAFDTRVCFSLPEPFCFEIHQSLNLVSEELSAGVNSHVQKSLLHVFHLVHGIQLLVDALLIYVPVSIAIVAALESSPADPVLAGALG